MARQNAVLQKVIKLCIKRAVCIAVHLELKPLTDSLRIQLVLSYCDKLALQYTPIIFYSGWTFVDSLRTSSCFKPLGNPGNALPSPPESASPATSSLKKPSTPRSGIRKGAASSTSPPVSQ